MPCRPKDVYEFHTAADCDKPANDAEQNVANRYREQASAKKKDCFVTERGKRSKAAEKTGEQKQSQGRREEVVMFSEAGENTDDKAAEHVHGESACWKIPSFRVMKNEAAEFEPGDGPNGAAEGDD